MAVARAARRKGVAKPSEAELALLALARQLAALPERARAGEAVTAAVSALADAYAPAALLPRTVCQAWLRSRGDKNATLALAWAREQVRLALEDILMAWPGRSNGPGVAPDTLAWLLLAAAEALAQEPPSAVADRVRALLAFTGRDAPPD